MLLQVKYFLTIFSISSINSTGKELFAFFVHVFDQMKNNFEKLSPDIFLLSQETFFTGWNDKTDGNVIIENNPSSLTRKNPRLITLLLTHISHLITKNRLEFFPFVYLNSTPQYVFNCVMISCVC